MEMDLISIIIPVYHAEAYIDRCVWSLVKQQYERIEILLIDDESSDGSLAHMQRLAEKDERIRILKKERKGVSAARNKGLEEAKGMYLAFVDSDDWVEPEFISDLYRAMRNSDIAICGFQKDYVDKNYSISHSLKRASFPEEKIGDMISELDRKDVFNLIWNKMYKRQIVETYRIRFPEELDTGEDLIFNCEYFRHITHAEFLSSMPYHYMQRNELSLVSKYRANYDKIIGSLIKARDRLYEFYQIDEIYRAERVHQNNLYRMTAVHNLFRIECQLKPEQKKAILKRIKKNSQKDIRLSYKKELLYEKIFIMVFSRFPIGVIYRIYKLLFGLRTRFHNVYSIFRRGVFQQNKRGLKQK